MSVDHEMRRVGRIIAADQGLDVAVRGVDAYARPGHVVIPNVEHFAWLGSRYARRMLHGLLDHECGHAKYTDFEAFKRWRQSRKPCAALDTLQQLVEDGYVERMQGAAYRGAQTNITLMNEWFYEQKREPDNKSLMQAIAEGGEDMIGLVLSAVGTTLTPHGERTIEFYEKLNPAVGAMVRLVEPEIREAQAITTTKATGHNIEIAERIFDKLAAAGGGGARLKDKHSIGGGAGPTGGAGGAEGEPLPGEALPGAEAFIDIERWTKEKGTAVSATDLIRVKLRSIFEMPKEVRPYTVFSHEFDVERDFSAEYQGPLTEEFEVAKSEARELADAMIFAFEAALRATAMVTPVSGADEGDIDPELLAQYAMGSVPSDQLYIQYEEGDSDETAVEILVDCSGSMGGSKADLARKTAIAMHMALQACQITHEVTGFTTLQSDETDCNEWVGEKKAEYDKLFRLMRAALKEAEEHGADVGDFARAICGWSGNDTADGDLMVPFHAVFKSWSSNDARSLMKIDGLDQNLDGEAVLWAARRLAMRPERRKVLFVLSDGLPAGSRDNAQGHRYLEEAVQRVVDSGMEIYGIGIESSAVQRFYPQWWVANNADDLISIAMSGLTEVLTQNRRERARVAI
jgi:hypothetical protein